ncbi:hypothetical protein C5167_036368 [Papaver somniferum]|uniref:Uncharacterized protein n=1 Tax=Papaver somniferum TaxID=3469 RepID=A0A4Y7I5Q3_PAPSO|nr:hypothetical protein C5167_036368 [Papaver somniferum]
MFAGHKIIPTTDSASLIRNQLRSYWCIETSFATLIIVYRWTEAWNWVEEDQANNEKFVKLELISKAHRVGGWCRLTLFCQPMVKQRRLGPDIVEMVQPRRCVTSLLGINMYC